MAFLRHKCLTLTQLDVVYSFYSYIFCIRHSPFQMKQNKKKGKSQLSS